MLRCKHFYIIFFCCSVNAAVEDRYYPRYHLAPPFGWMNDPNGFCIFNKEYHLFYQFNPNSSFNPGIVHWGHAKSRDLFHWDDLGVAMYPDQWYDKSGVFSGSALVEDDVMYLFYTGNVNLPGQTPDHEQHQALAISSDGIKVDKLLGNPIINGTDLQPNIRDPKVWKHKDTYYMVLGNSIKNDTLGRILLFSSKDKLNWEQVSVLAQSDGRLGYMFECPDFFELNGRFVLLFSPQGVKPEGDKYKNLYQTGYIVGAFDYNTHIFEPLTEFKEMDHGHDIYATQTLRDDYGHRIVIAWSDMWEETYPEQPDGFNGHMTIPRILSLSRDGHLIQKPVKQIAAARGRVIHSGKTRGDTTVMLNDNAAEIFIRASATKNFDLFIESKNASKTVLISYDSKQGTVTLDRGGNDAIRRTTWKPKGRLIWNIYIDASSVELFCGEGEVTFTSRFFPDGPVRVRLGKQSQAEELRVTNMKRTLYLKKDKQ